MDKKVTVVSGVTKERWAQLGFVWPEEFDVRYAAAKGSYREEDLRDAEYMVVNASDPISAEMMDKAPNLKYIHTNGISFNAIDIAHAAERGVAVSNCRAGNAVSVAEHTIGLVLDSVKKISYLDRHIRRDGYADTYKSFPSLHVREMTRLTVGMIGMGAIGREVARRLLPWGSRLVYADPYPLPPEKEAELGLTHVELDELCRISDVITIHLPVMPSTVGMIGQKQVDEMKDGVVLVNVARGVVCENDAMIRGLESGRIGVYAVDTFDPENPGPDHPFFHMSEPAQDRLVMTTHTAGRTDDAMAMMFQWCIDDCVDYYNGKLPKNIVNGVTQVR